MCFGRVIFKPTYIIRVLLEKLSTRRRAVSFCGRNLALGTSKVARDLCEALLCWNPPSALFTCRIALWINLPADMIDNMNRDEAMEETDL
jgi:hypothetical protein